MIIISGTMSFNASDHDDAIASLIKVNSLSRQDPGCVEYAWTQDLESPDTFRFFECWESKSDLDAHMVLPHVVAFNDTLAKLTAVTATSYTATPD